jgi:hypothetical protein
MIDDVQLDSIKELARFLVVQPEVHLLSQIGKSAIFRKERKQDQSILAIGRSVFVLTMRYHQTSAYSSIGIGVSIGTTNDLGTQPAVRAWQSYATVHRCCKKPAHVQRLAESPCSSRKRRERKNNGRDAGLSMERERWPQPS